MKKLSLLLLTTGIYLLLTVTFLKMYLADLYFVSSKTLLSNGQIREATEHIIKATSLNNNEPAYKRQKAKVLLSTTIWESGDEIKQAVLDELQKAENLNSKNLATTRNIIPLYYLLAVEDIDENAGIKNTDPKYLDFTRTYFIKLKNTYPNDLGIYTDVAKYERKLGLDQEYSKTVQSVQKMRPEILKWHEAFN